MSTVKLVRLELTNYRNIDHAVFEFNGDNCKIVGENRVGKTNTLEAIYWLLTDKLLNGSNDIAAIKPTNDTSRIVSVKGIFDVEGKGLIEIQKDYAENWTKMRGTNELEFKGHSTTYYYNGVKQGTQKAFQLLLNDDFGILENFGKIEIARLLVDPTYIGELGESTDWTELRSFIIKLIGNVSDEDVFLREPRLTLIQADLLQVSGRVDQLKKRYRDEIKGLNETIIGNDAQIQMLERIEKPNVDLVESAKKSIEEIDDRVAKLQGQKVSDAMSSVLLKQINEKVEAINELQISLAHNNPLRKEQASNHEEHARANEAYIAAKDNVAKVESDLKVMKQHIIDIQYHLSTLDSKRNDLLIKLSDLDTKIKNPKDFVETVCPVCHREFDNVDETINSSIEFWKKEKESTIAVGKKNKEEMDSLKEELSTSNTQITSLESQLDAAKNDLAVKEADLDRLSKRKVEIYDELMFYVPTSPELDSLRSELDSLKERLNKINQDTAAQELELQSMIRAELEKKESLREIIDKYNYWQLQQEQLTKVENERTENMKELANKEQKLEMVQTFMFKKLKMLDENLSTVFGNIKFKLIKDNINGGYDPICKPFIYNIDKDESKNVLWKSGSKSERIVTGIAIAECIKRKLGLGDLPFLFDEGGEISSDTFATKFKTKSQLICVKVADNIKTPIVLKI